MISILWGGGGLFEMFKCDFFWTIWKSADNNKVRRFAQTKWLVSKETNQSNIQFGGQFERKVY